jgi:uncharacterized membrane protein YcaP (DUF421 family)
MLSQVFSFNQDPLELFVRGTAMYWFLFCMFRFVLRRDVGAVGIADVLLLVIVADAAQNAMAGEYKTVPEGMLLVATLLFWNWLLDFTSFRFRAVRRLVEPPPLPLVRGGKMLHRNMRREFITEEELMTALRQKGVKELSEVEEVFMESDGNFSVIKRRR